MKREWQPGDVAATEYRGVKSLAMVVKGRGACPSDHPHGLHWHGMSGGWNPLDDTAVIYRPLVVIDPEDRNAVERLSRLHHAELGGTPDEFDGDLYEATKAALREFANPTPPKPEEPTGLGAVVEGGCGCSDEPKRFVRDPAARDFNLPWDARNVERGDEVPWVASCGHHRYEDLAAVRVLSEGVVSC